MNSLTANMLNIWYPVANAPTRRASADLRRHRPRCPARGRYDIDSAPVARCTAFVLRTKAGLPYGLILLLALATMIQPMTITRAHE